MSVIDKALEKQNLVVENRRLLTEVSQHDRETSILLSVSQAMSQSLELGGILGSVAGRVRECLGVDACYIYLKTDGRFVFTAADGLDEAAAEILKKGRLDAERAERVQAVFVRGNSGDAFKRLVSG